MRASLLPLMLQTTERKIRLLTILDAFQSVGLSPTRISAVHAVAYLTDALAPVWHLPILDAQVLKRRRQPFFPALQRDLDALVGQGLVHVERLSYERSDEDDGWRLDADYVLSTREAEPIFRVIHTYDLQARKFFFVREVVYAASALGPSGIDSIGLIDAAYSDPFVDVGGVVDMSSDSEGPNPTAEVALRFAALTRDSRTLSDTELVHLYVRHLYSRMQVA